MALVVDTGPLLASMDRGDRDYGRCRDLLRDSDEQLIVPAPVLPELDYFLQKLSGSSSVEFLRSVESGAVLIEDLALADYARVREIMARYADARVGFVDAAVLAIVERLNEPKLATLDRRHFTLMRPRHIEALALLPG